MDGSITAHLYYEKKSPCPSPLQGVACDVYLEEAMHPGIYSHEDIFHINEAAI